MARSISEIRAAQEPLRRHVGQLVDQKRELDIKAEVDGVTDGLTERRANIERGISKASAQLDELRAEHQERLRTVVESGSYHAEEGVDLTNPRAEADRDRADIDDRVDPRLRRDRDDAMRTVERHGSVLGARGQDRLDDVLRRGDPLGSTARYVAAVGTSSYESAFAKMLADPTNGHLRFDREEVEAVRAVSRVQAESRAMSDGTGSAGGFGLPLTIDPSMVLVGAGVLNPLREVARVETIGVGREWRGISTDGVVSAFGAEAVEATDASPTVAQPTVIVQKAFCFVPFSIEQGTDYPDLLQELSRIIADSKNVLEATKYLSGSGTNEPGGILNIGGTGGLTTTQRVQTAASGAFAYADVWTAREAVPARFLANASWLVHQTTLDTIYQFSPTGSTTLSWLMPEGRNGPLAGLPTAQLSTMATGATTGTKIAVLGDFKTGFRIVDRLGMSVELVPHILGTARGFPTGSRGLYAWWRTGSTVIGASSAAGCALRYLEAK